MYNAPYPPPVQVPRPRLFDQPPLRPKPAGRPLPWKALEATVSIVLLVVGVLSAYGPYMAGDPRAAAARAWMAASMPDAKILREAVIDRPEDDGRRDFWFEVKEPGRRAGLVCLQTRGDKIVRLLTGREAEVAALNWGHPFPE